MSQFTKRSDQELNPDLLNEVVAGLYTKGMSHDETTGVGSLSELRKLQVAVFSSCQSDFDDITLAGTRKQANVQAALVSDQLLKVRDLLMPPPPAIASEESAAELVELYWMALLRDQSFASISAGSGDTSAALGAINAFGSSFTGPKAGGVVTGQTLFRSLAGNQLVGPYVSQLLYHDVPMGGHVITQKYTADTGSYGINASNWLSIQNGNVPVPQTKGASRYVATPRDIGSVVHNDFIYQHFLYAAAILLSRSVPRSRFVSTPKEGSFITNGGPAGLASLIGELSRHALQAAWIQKWVYHLRARPEAMAGLVVKEEAGELLGAVHESLFTTGASTLSAVKAANLADGGESEAWLNLLYAEGSPTHPAYPAGHAVISGALGTLLKIFFDDGAWATTGLAAVHSTDGESLISYSESDSSSMTIHGEISKLTSNLANARNMAGVHYRSDGDQGVLLGEKVAIRFWQRVRQSFNEGTGASTFTNFNGASQSLDLSVS